VREITVRLIREAEDALWTTGAADGVNEADVVNRALQLYAQVLSSDPGRTFTFKRPHGQPDRVVTVNQ
jgi:hypothetical protein